MNLYQVLATRSNSTSITHAKNLSGLYKKMRWLTLQKLLKVKNGSTTQMALLEMSLVTILFSVPNFNLMATIDSRNAWADTSISSNLTNITLMFPLLVLTFTRSDSNPKNTNLQELVICLVLIT